MIDIGDVSVTYSTGDEEHDLPVYTFEADDWRDEVYSIDDRNHIWPPSFADTLESNDALVDVTLEEYQRLEVRIDRELDSTTEVLRAFTIEERRGGVNSQVMRKIQSSLDYRGNPRDDYAVIAVRVFNLELLEAEGIDTVFTEDALSILPHGVAFIRDTTEDDIHGDDSGVLGYAHELHDDYLTAVAALAEFRERNASKLLLWETIADLLGQSGEPEWHDDAPETSDLYDALGIDTGGREGIQSEHQELLMNTARRKWGEKLLQMSTFPADLNGGYPVSDDTFDALIDDPASVVEEYEDEKSSIRFRRAFSIGWGPDYPDPPRKAIAAAESEFMRFGLRKLRLQLEVEQRAALLVWLFCSSASAEVEDNSVPLSWDVIEEPLGSDEYDGRSHDDIDHYVASGYKTEMFKRELGMDDIGTGKGFMGAFAPLEYEQQVHIMANLTRGLGESYIGRQFLTELVNPGLPLSDETVGGERLFTMNAIRFFDPDSWETDEAFDERDVDEVGLQYILKDRQFVNTPQGFVFEEDGAVAPFVSPELRDSLVTLAQNLFPGIIGLYEYEDELDFDATDVSSVQELVRYETWALLSTFVTDDTARAELDTLTDDSALDFGTVQSIFGMVSDTHGILDDITEFLDDDIADVDFDLLDDDQLETLQTNIKSVDSTKFNISLLFWLGQLAVTTSELHDGDTEWYDFVEAIPTYVNLSAVERFHKEYAVQELSDTGKNHFRYANMFLSTIDVVFSVADFWSAVTDGDVEDGVTSGVSTVGSTAGLVQLGVQAKLSAAKASGAGASAMFLSRASMFLGIAGWVISAGLFAWSMYRRFTATGELEEWLSRTTFGSDPGGPVEPESDGRYFLYDDDQLEDPYLWQLSGFFWLQFPISADQAEIFGPESYKSRKFAAEVNFFVPEVIDPHFGYLGQIAFDDSSSIESGSSIVIQTIEKDGNRYVPGSIVHAYTVSGWNLPSAFDEGVLYEPTHFEDFESDTGETASTIRDVVSYGSNRDGHYIGVFAPDEETWETDNEELNEYFDDDHIETYFNGRNFDPYFGDNHSGKYFDAIFGYDPTDLDEDQYLLVYHIPEELLEQSTSPTADTVQLWLTQFPRTIVEVDPQFDLDEVDFDA